ncbi:29 kDa ribonucleoprotein A, chloroplast precursor, putative [Entamoeba dispar SAW760]|uniref:29 kDa ribonucleoprotein A, chloroplast, putative n=1 Tax=Entamoeba dispar (strain ATCC PRA-260 / SAW760) TaxID=370354 RepID=B0EH38_ENTDS|nr:29 kDa ribonucleoprotein A, chloroplast precursor, putative [Entamoeba dispar SAW760]EDR26160.1 29 kDa ribonucleoprotein A, chloroplast precursor, putative [Entamoeba dispar SAW760]|eukprot:EDR26160.1 29 kDa ribonucleoprotein A, chloroplast precursor, putative [Entamoeba dispar SAW760]
MTNNERQKPYNPETSVFIGKLPKSMKENEIREKFITCGRISRMMMQYYPNGQSKGCCFIEFEDKKGAERACSRDGSIIDKQYIRVNMAEKKPKKVNYKHLPKVTQKKMNNSYCIFVGKVSAITTESTLVKIFAKCGKVLRVTIPIWRNTNKRRGFAIVEFASLASVEKALELANTTVDGKQITVMKLDDVLNKEKHPKTKKEKKDKSSMKKKLTEETKEEKEQGEEEIKEEEITKEERDIRGDGPTIKMEEDDSSEDFSSKDIQKEIKKEIKQKRQEELNEKRADEDDIFEQELLKMETTDN